MQGSIERFLKNYLSAGCTIKTGEDVVMPVVYVV
jgi:hypothetical protein